MYDVAVVGAGPAGSTVSRNLAKSGLKVCLLDKDTFPRDKPCGGGFSKGLLDEFSYLRKRSFDFIEGIAKVGILHSPNRQITLRGKVDMAVTLRVDFDKVLFESATEQGAEPYTGTRVKHVIKKTDHYELELDNHHTLRASIVVGADGVSSMVGRETGLHPKWGKNEITACRVAEIPAKPEEIWERYTDELHYHFFANLDGLPGYGWIFPKRNTINVGLGILGSHAKNLLGIFERYVNFLKHQNLLMHDSDLSAARGALVPTGGPVKESQRNGCVLVGDSAGMVSPLTGGGIGYAMRAARYASDVIVDALQNRNESKIDLRKYELLWRNDFGGAFKSQLLAQRIMTGPFTNLLFQIGQRDLQLQEMVSESMAESSQGEISMKRLLARTLLVCVRGAFGID